MRENVLFYISFRCASMLGGHWLNSCPNSIRETVDFIIKGDKLIS